MTRYSSFPTELPFGFAKNTWAMPQSLNTGPEENTNLRINKISVHFWFNWPRLANQSFWSTQLSDKSSDCHVLAYLPLPANARKASFLVCGTRNVSSWSRSLELHAGDVGNAIRAGESTKLCPFAAFCAMSYVVKENVGAGCLRMLFQKQELLLFIDFMKRK